MVFWGNMMLVALVSQSVTLQTFDLRAEPSQTSVSLGTILIWFAASFIYTFVCGRNGYKLALWMYVRKARPNILARYQHWGMEREVFGDSTLLWLINATILGFLSIGGIFWYIAPATTPITVDPMPTAIYLALSLGLPVYGGVLDHRGLETRREKLDALHPAFQARFPVSEILSMYECLRSTPPLFWHEYTELPERQINKATNQEFRNRASSYHLLESQINQRIMLTVGVVAVIAAVPSLTFLFLEGTLIQWLSDLFTAPTPP